MFSGCSLSSFFVAVQDLLGQIRRFNKMDYSSLLLPTDSERWRRELQMLPTQRARRNEDQEADHGRATGFWFVSGL